METLGAIAVVLLVLACPLGMLAIGGTVWLVGRVRGQKKDFSAGCMHMSGHEDQNSGSRTESELREQVARLEGEVESLRSRTPAGRSES